MKSKKNVLVSLFIFIVAIFVLSLFGQKPPKLEDRVVKLETIISELQPRIEALETKLSTLDSKITSLETWKSALKSLNPPDYDSGWKAIELNETLTLSHNLGGEPNKYVVDLQFKHKLNGIHQIFHGGTSDNQRAFWMNLDSTRIFVARWPNDVRIQNVRVRIWKY